MISILPNPVTILLGLLCLQWVALASAGPLSLQMPYFALAIVILYAASGPRKLAASGHFVRANVAWIAPLFGYLAFTGVALHGTPAETIVPRQMFFLIGAIAFAACTATARRLPYIFRAGGIIGIACFVGAVELLAQSIGLSWAVAVVRFINGDFNFVMYSFFRGVFNALDPTADNMLSAATKNISAVSLFVLALLFRSGSKDPQKDIIGVILVGLALVLLLIMNTRSVLIVAGLALLVATLVGAVIRPVRSLPLLVLKLIGLLGLLVAAALLYLPEQGFADMLSDRFAFDDYSTASRLDQFQVALDQIQKHPIAGSGYFEVNGHIIHNLFLAAWVHGGVVAFVLAVLFYVALVAHWIGVVARVISQPERWVIPIAFEWIAPLPMLPLFRVWLSGDAGNLFLGEWVAISAFLGCVLANDRMRRRLAGLQQGIISSEAQPRSAFVTRSNALDLAGSFGRGSGEGPDRTPRRNGFPGGRRGVPRGLDR